MPQAPASGTRAVQVPKFPPDYDADDASQAFANALFLQAHEIERERADVMERQAANRTQLRLLDRQGLLSEAQGEYLDAFYPEKERGERRGREDVELTRRVREAARRGS